MLSQRIYGLALGYEDLNDHEQLRKDVVFGLLSGKPELEAPLAGKSTLNRLELSGRSKRSHKISPSVEAMIGCWWICSSSPIRRCQSRSCSIWMPPISRCTAISRERFFHGYYDSYCYLPLYIFAGDQLLCARLRAANQDAAAGWIEELKRIVGQLRQRWPQVNIVLRADSGFCREALMAWCEQKENRVEYVFGLQRNRRLQTIIGNQIEEVKKQHQATGKASRMFTEFLYRTHKSWSCSRRVVAKAEYLDKGDNPRL